MKIIKPKFFDNINIISCLLLPFSFLVLVISKIKKISSKKNFKIKTICVGNIYIGGTGKTPLVIKINKILRKKYNTVFIKKYYPDQIDEQKLLKQNGKLISTDYRENAIKIAEKNKYNLAIVDDGLQQKNMNYSISIVCFNSSAGIGNGFLIPSGPLRESISEIKNYDAVFLNGEKENIKLKKIFKNINKNIKIFNAKYVVKNIKNFNLKKKYLFFCGLGNPDEFEKTLKKNKFRIKEKFIYPDHYKYLNKDISKLKNIAKNKNLEIITSEKDYLRLSKSNKKGIKFIKIELKIKNYGNFLKFLNQNL
tara:strand:+ start:317 stop:1240 length:924 start_codon:yes stop_codon:yes gene_type:complete